jgi:hypothetical protein
MKKIHLLVFTSFNTTAVAFRIRTTSFVLCQLGGRGAKDAADVRRDACGLDNYQSGSSFERVQQNGISSAVVCTRRITSWSAWSASELILDNYQSDSSFVRVQPNGMSSAIQ